MPPAFAKQRRAITKLVQQQGQPALLRRAEGDRPCFVFLSSFTAIEMMGRSIEPNTRRVLLAATPEVVATPPDMNRDALVTYVQPMTSPPTEDVSYRITEPPQTIAPDGVPAYYRLAVRR